MAVDHYENFPVASLLMPARLRPAVAAIYAFARSADDLADEGTAEPAERLAALAAFDSQLDRIAAGQIVADAPAGAMFRRLAEVIEQYSLDLKPFHDLLSAFSQDVHTLRYNDYSTVLDYCQRSANPVGRLMLALYGANAVENVYRSDCICTALQLINFWQDVAIDRAKDRVYLPLEDLRRFHVEVRDLDAGIVTPPVRALMDFEVQRTRALMLEGAPLACALPGRIGLELRFVVQGGLRILEKIEAVGYDVFRRRPVLQTRDWLVLAARAFTMRA